ncbi:unnamed protein product [Lepeophtheirus salmonis]|uniref:(salmon louse) hypothetical protein n=1 Tax=Lepeophtheirus salmonis TaxID=72036 RepID=A0A7R8H891_LEPSM|nr:unnamed protein product [Lepeophtheirus salmonis]CAF2937680.1 unnamed protein product [Lepeophtheirus salmonis]
MEEENLIICLIGFTTRNPKIFVGDKERLERDVLSAPQIFVHKSNRKDFTDKKRTDEATAKDKPQPKLLRSGSGLFDFKQRCFLCGRSSTIDTKYPDRNTIHLVTFLDFYRSLLEKYEGRYRKYCLKRFMIDKKYPDLDGGERGRPRDERMFYLFEILCIWLEVDSDAGLHTLKELHDKMSSFAGTESMYSPKRLTQKLQERYGNK